MHVLAHMYLACLRHGVAPTRFGLLVRVSTQTLFWFERMAGNSPWTLEPRCNLLKQCRCSTSRFGIGQSSGSNRTPLGLHRIAEKIGGGWPVGTAFRGRQPVGYTWKGFPGAKITGRILWLEGLEPGLNRGGDVDSHGRYIYVHGTGEEPSLGSPASCGCIHLAADDLIPLFDCVPQDTLVWIGQ